MQDDRETDDGPERAATPAAKRPLARRLAPLAILALLVGGAYATGLHEHLSLDTLAREHERLSRFVADNFLLAAGAYILLYVVVVAASLPGGAMMTVTGGFLFGTAFGTVFAVTGATIGATAIFLIARTALGDVLREKAGGALARMAEGFRKDAFNYLLFLRLVPAFPFFVINLAPAFLGVRTRTYVAATAIGIVPGTFVFASVGAGFGSVLAQGGEISLSGILTPQVATALVGLAVLALVPVAVKRVRARGGAAQS